MKESDFTEFCFSTKSEYPVFVSFTIEESLGEPLRKDHSMKNTLNKGLEYLKDVQNEVEIQYLRNHIHQQGSRIS